MPRRWLFLCRQCSTCAGHQSESSKAAVHPWMWPEKPWSRLHIDHAINFLGFNWLVVKDALQDFLGNYRRTPLSTGYAPSELLNRRQIRTKIDTLLPSPAHTAKGKQAKEATKSQQSERQLPVTQVSVTYKVGDPCYALYFGPRRDRDPRWVLAIVVKRFGIRSVNVRVVPRGPVWRLHIDQLRRRYVSPDEKEPGDTPRLSESREENPSVSEQLSSDTSTATTGQPPTSQNVSPDYGPSHPRRSKRPRKPRELFCC